MPTPASTPLSPPKYWQEFQTLCRDLWSEIWDDSNTQENGRQGQPQAGVDVFGHLKQISGWGGVQCKQKDNLADANLSVGELKTEVDKAKNFRPPLKEFIVATTGPRDAKIQEEARRITALHLERGFFTVHVWSWEDIEVELTNYPHLLQKYYPDQFGSTSAATQLAREVISEVTQRVEATGNEVVENLSDLIVDGLGGIKQEIKIQRNSELEAESTYIKKLIDANKPKTCIEFIDELVKKRWDVVSERSRFKLLTNKATCLLQLGKDEDAGALFVRALQYGEKDEKALVNAALGFLLLKEEMDASRCLEQVLQRNPLNHQAWNLKIQFSKDSAELQAAMETIPKSLLEKTEINWAYGVTLQRFGSLVEAERYMQLALDRDVERRIDLVVQLGSLKLKNCLDDVRLVGTRSLTPEIRSKLEASESLFTEALRRLSESDVVPVRIQAATNRGIVKRFLGKVDEAKRDLDQAIEWDPSAFQAVKQHAIISAEEGQFEDAIKRLKPFANNENTPEARILLADTFRLSKKHQEAIKIVENCETWQADPEIRIHGLVILTECYLEIQDKLSGLSAVEKMKNLLPGSFAPFLLQARVERLCGEKDLAAQVALTAKSMIGKDVDFFDEWRLGDELYELGLFADAADVYSRLAVPERDDLLTRRLTEAHFRAEQWKQALECCTRVRIHHPELQYASEIASSIYESTGNLQAAIDTLREYLAIKVDDDHARLRLATVLWRDGKQREAEVELGKIRNPENLGAKGVLHYASLISAKGEVEKAIKILFEARRKYSNKPEIDMGYISIILGRGERLTILEDPAVAVADTVVFLENENHEKELYIIEDRADADFLKREINLESSIAKELIGKKIGEKVDLEKNPIQPRLWTICALKSKFAHALSETMSSHSKRFPDRRDFLAFTTPTDEKGEVDAEGLRKQMLSALPDESVTQTIEDYYRQGHLTIGSIAKLAGRDLLATTIHLAVRQDLGIYSSTGSRAEYETALQNVRSSSGLVLDPVSIIILDLLKARDIFVDRYAPLVIAQSTLDEFNKVLALRSVGGMQPGLTVFREKGELYKEEISAENKRKQLESLQSLIEWIRAHCSVQPVDLVLTMNKSERGKMEEIFGVPTFESLLLAKGNGLLLYTEDGRMRNFAEKEHQVNGIWTHCLMTDALSKGYITEDQFKDLTISLLSLNIHHVPITSDILVTAAKKSSWRVDYPFSSVLFNLTGVRSEENSSVVVAGEFIYALWTQALAPLTRDVLLLALLDAITSHRKRDVVMRKIEIVIGNKFRLWPRALKALLAIVETWKATRMT